METKQRIEELKAQLKELLDDALSVSQVRYCGTPYEEYDTPAVWIEYLETVRADARIRSAFVYFPTCLDPTTYPSVEAMKEAGLLRTFCYVGLPDGWESGGLPGILCVHGGIGHAYAQYVMEAVNHGYAAIAPDTEGHVRKDFGADGFGDPKEDYFQDPLSIPKDSLQGWDKDMTEQWQCFVQRLLIYCNTFLRSLDAVNESRVGITGISWGGFVVTTALQYDHRYAFAVPVYISAALTHTEGIAIANVREKPHIAALWQDSARLSRVRTPVLLLNGDNDPFASPDNTLMSEKLIPSAQMCLLHGYTHSQQRGAARSEIYLFGKRAMGLSDGLPAFLGLPSDVTVPEYTLSVVPNAALTAYRAVLYYQTEPITYTGLYEYNTSKTRLPWNELPLTVESDGSIRVSVPKEAVVYYVSVFAHNADEATMPAVYYPYTGEVVTTTPLVPIGCKAHYEIESE